MPNFTRFRDMIAVPKFKSGSRDHDHTLSGVVCHHEANTWYSLPYKKFDNSSFSRSSDGIAAQKI